MIEVHNLRKAFGEKEVLKDISFRVNDGDVIAVHELSREGGRRLGRFRRRDL